MNQVIVKSEKFLFILALFTLIALWNIPNTIAGRYISAGILLITTLLLKPNWGKVLPRNKVLIIFCIYLLIHLIFFSTDFHQALQNFNGEWLKFIMFSTAGLGAGMVLGRLDIKNLLLYLGIAFSFPLYVHLMLFGLKLYETGVIPWKYIGISETHGPLAYASLQASILLSTFLLTQARTSSIKLISVLLISICIASPLLAGSRGGLVFALVCLLSTYLIYFIFSNHKQDSGNKKYLGLILVCVATAVSIFAGIKTDPQRWDGLLSRFSVGLVGDPIQVYCKGIPYLVDELVSKKGSIDENTRLGIESVINGDGARILGARSGLALVAKNMMGIDGSKEAYQIAISKECGRDPLLFISHTHNAWLDTILAIGIPGALLLFGTMAIYAIGGYSAFKKGGAAISPYGLALLMSTLLWGIRGLVDGTQRDQMLEIQGFIFALLFGVMLYKTESINKILKAGH